jgi:hypothetical protein
MNFSEKICLTLSKLFFKIPFIPRPKSVATIDEYCEQEFNTAKEINKTFKSQIVFSAMV